MGLDMVLNEVSLIDAANDIPTAKQMMSELYQTIETFIGIAGRGHSKLEVCTPKGIKALPLAPEYPMGRWMGDKSVDDRQRTLLITIAANRPFIDDVNDTYEEEFLYEEKSVKSLGYAFQKGALALSMKSAPCWDQSYLELEHRHLDEAGELVRDLVDLIHASRKVHVEEHASWIKSFLRAKADRLVIDGASLWERREELFPHLQFCSVVETHLQAVFNGSKMLHPILTKLFLLEQYCEKWLTGPFDAKKIGCVTNPESEATLEKYWKARTFDCPDGQTRLFSWHIKLTPEAWRMYFFPLPDKGQFIIGYIGRHLPIVTS